MHSNLKLFLAFAILGPVSFFVSGQVYDQFIVPRLPEVQRVPLWWWCGQLIWPSLVFAAAGWFSRTFVMALSLSAIAFFPIYLFGVASDVVRGQSVGHDMSATDPSFWVASLAQFALWYAIAAGTHVARRVFGTKHAAA